MALIGKSNSMSAAELSQKKAELKLKHKVVDELFTQLFVLSLSADFQRIFSHLSRLCSNFWVRQVNLALNDC